jgi:hypothetical protein
MEPDDRPTARQIADALAVAIDALPKAKAKTKSSGSLA